MQIGRKELIERIVESMKEVLTECGATVTGRGMENDHKMPQQPSSATSVVLNSDEENGQLTEMARINKGEDSIFPYAGWEIKIWSNDHLPRHFHILKDGWNVSFEIETGRLLGVEAQGKNMSVYRYMVNNVADWLSSPCAAQAKLSNRENADLVWEQLH